LRPPDGDQTVQKSGIFFRLVRLCCVAQDIACRDVPEQVVSASQIESDFGMAHPEMAYVRVPTDGTG
jgi:hypothetical protein